MAETFSEPRRVLLKAALNAAAPARRRRTAGAGSPTESTCPSATAVLLVVLFYSKIMMNLQVASQKA